MKKTITLITTKGSSVFIGINEIRSIEYHSSILWYHGHDIIPIDACYCVHLKNGDFYYIDKSQKDKLHEFGF